MDLHTCPSFWVTNRSVPEIRGFSQWISLSVIGCYLRLNQQCERGLAKKKNNGDAMGELDLTLAQKPPPPP